MTDPVVRYEPAAAGEADAIAQLHALSWKTAYRGILPDSFLDGEVDAERRAVWRRRFTDPPPSQLVLVARVAGSAAGFVCVRGSDSATWGSLIDNLHVDPAYRSLGIGTRLLLEASRWLLAQHPGAGVHLFVWERNVAARRLYERLGAAHVETFVKGTPGGGQGVSCRYAWPTIQALHDRAAGDLR
jgi:ribosomal protein S18 acetylase RimI-like enzyme